MDLNIGGSGEYRNIVKFNANVGRWYFRNGETETEIDAPTMLIDLANIATGWLLFLEGSAPNRLWDPSLDTKAPPPSDAHKRGFMVLCYSPKYLGGMAELSSCSMNLSNAVKDLYAAFEVHREKHPGKLPVVSCVGTVEKKGKYGTNHKPNFQIVDWTDRPKELSDESPADPTEAWKGDGAPTPTRPQKSDYSPPVEKVPVRVLDNKAAKSTTALF